MFSKEDFSEELMSKVASLPTNPGIYQYKNNGGKIIYVGKAKNLKNRVRSYFQLNKVRDAKTTALVSKIADIEVIIVDSEAEALILEDNLIKKYKPRYNIMLRDDKTYPFIKITNEAFPRIFLTRKVIKDGSKYLGPHTDIRNIRFLMNTVRHIFQLRSCKLNLTKENVLTGKFRPCLDYQIGKCHAPCAAYISYENYNQDIKMATQVLVGKTKILAEELEASMYKFSENLEFEKANEAKCRLEALKEYTSKQKIVTSDLIDRDIFGLCIKSNVACSLIFNIRDGKLINKRHFIITNADIATNEELLQRTIEKWYLETDFIPKEIFLPNKIDQLEYILDWLGKKKKQIISVQIPKIGDKRKLVEMAITNAEFILGEYLLSVEKRDKKVSHSIQALQRDLNLPKLPFRIECYDNSHLQGTDIVSSMVVFINGRPKKSEYRKFKAREVIQNDDFATMRETIYRRFSRAIEEKQDLPDLIIVDGGKGQISSAYRILCELNLENKISIIGLAKRLEEVFFPNVSDSIMLPKTSSSLKLIQQLRDESHRFAITFHKQLRSKRITSSELDNIKNIGPATKQKLLSYFGSVKNLKNASEEEISKLVNIKQLEALKKKLNSF